MADRHQIAPNTLIEFLCLHNVTLRLGRRSAFRRSHWIWNRGEQWAIAGPDGSGKSLLVQALLGRVPLKGGEIRGPHGLISAPEVDPDATIALVSPEVQRHVVLGETSFYQSRWHSGVEEGGQTVAQFLSQERIEGRNPFEVNAPTGNVRAFQWRRRELVRLLNLRPLWNRRVAQLSNGELRKVLLVHALLRGPRLLILEDPFAGLDVVTRGVLKRVITELMQSGLPVLLVTQRIEEIPRQTTHLLLVDQHRILAQGPKVAMLRSWRPFDRAAPGAQHSGGDRIAGRQTGSVAATPEVVVELHAVTVEGKAKRILHRIDWTVRERECWLLLGPNGAGKTTLLNLIQGDHPQAYSQDLRLFGRSTDSTQTLWQSRQQMGWMSPELHQHYPANWPAIDVVASGYFNTLGLFEACSRQKRSAALQWLQELGLRQHARDLFGELSFGQQRLVLLARSIVKRPRLLVLDEPCQGLDSIQRVAFLSAVDRFVAQAACTLIFVTHRPEESPRCITHLLRLKHGKVQQAGPLRRSAR